MFNMTITKDDIQDARNIVENDMVGWLTSNYSNFNAIALIVNSTLVALDELEQKFENGDIEED